MRGVSNFNVLIGQAGKCPKVVRFDVGKDVACNSFLTMVECFGGRFTSIDAIARWNEVVQKLR